MRRPPLCKIAIFIVFTLLIILIYKLLDFKSSLNYSQDNAFTIIPRPTPSKNINQIEVKRIVISFVVCDSRLKESLNVVKSVLIFTRTPVQFVIFTEKQLKPKFEEILSLWRNRTNGQLGFELHLINFPKPHKDNWINLFKKCSSQRLFIPELITHLDALIYVDTDTVFLGPADELWRFFSRFNSSQITAMALEHDNPNLSWYPRFAKHPFYGTLGLNSGVMLMNLTRMREFGWAGYITPVMLKWKLDIPWGDQDIINIIFHHHESRVLELSCRFNYRSDQCMYGDACAAASRRGVHLLHGSRKAFYSHKQPAFEAIHRAVKEYEVGTDPAKTFLPNLEKYLMEAPESNCGYLRDAFLKVPRRILAEVQSSVKPNKPITNQHL